MDYSNMSRAEILELAKKEGRELTDQELDAIASGGWSEDKEYTVTHEWVFQPTNDRGCGQTFKTKERYLEYCPLCHGYINWHAPED